tara:strand:- start:328 stop:501 length:174 start_codon:yes stop_codon:yes gene_type:complete
MMGRSIGFQNDKKQEIARYIDDNGRMWESDKKQVRYDPENPEVSVPKYSEGFIEKKK